MTRIYAFFIALITPSFLLAGNSLTSQLHCHSENFKIYLSIKENRLQSSINIYKKNSDGHFRSIFPQKENMAKITIHDLQNNAEVLFSPNQGHDQKIFLYNLDSSPIAEYEQVTVDCNVTHRLWSKIQDLFPFKIESKKKELTFSLEKMKESVLENSTNNQLFTPMTFQKISVDEISKKFFSVFYAEEKEFVTDFLKENARCLNLDGVQGYQEKKCLDDVQFDRVYLGLKISNDLPYPEIRIDPYNPKKQLILPTRSYAQIVQKMKQKSYTLKVSIPENTPYDEIIESLSHFPDYMDKNLLISIFLEGREKGYIDVIQLFNQFSSSKLNQFDYTQSWYCHNTALGFIDERLIDLVGEPQPSKYFDIISTNSVLKFGDIISLGTSHSMVYLFDGFVFMKDDNNSQWSFRIAKISDLISENHHMNMYFIQYFDRLPTRVLRYNGKL